MNSTLNTVAHRAPIHVLLLTTLILLVSACSGEGSENASSPNASSSSSSIPSSSSSTSSASSSTTSSSSSSSSSSSTSSGSSSSSSSSASSSSSSSSSNSSSSSSTSSGTLTFNSFRALPTAPIVDDEWSTGETRAIKDNQTGDLLVFRGSSKGDTSNHKLHLSASRDNGSTWQVVATDVSNPGSGAQWPSRILAVTQDSTGMVHALTSGTGGSTGYYYLRLALLRTGGHVTGFSLHINPIALPNHNRATATDLRGDIGVYRLNGAEVVVWAYNMGVTQGPNTDLKVYAGRSTSTLPQTSSDMVKLDGGAGDTLAFSHDNSPSVCKLCNHLTEALFTQNETSEELYLFIGQLNADFAVNVGTSAELNLRAIRFTKSSSGWTSGPTTTIATPGSVPPQLIDVDSAYDKAWVMYIHPSNGISFGYFDASGSFVSGPTSPAPTAGRAAFGAFTAADDGDLWAIWHTYGNIIANPTDMNGGASHWSGTAWTTFIDSGVRNTNGIASVWGWADGVAAIRFDGALLSQDQSEPSAATLYGR